MMTTNLKEEKFVLLSRFFDGETLSEDELNMLLSDNEVLEKWQSYALERAALRGECTDIDGMNGFAARVAEAIESEPLDMSRTISKRLEESVMSDLRSRTHDRQFKDTPKAEVVALKKDSKNKNSSWLGHVALAASVACICIFGGSIYLKDNSNFNEESFIDGNTNISISPVSTSLTNEQLSMHVGSEESLARQTLQFEKEQLRLNEERKARELRTLDALMNNHELMQRMTNNEVASK